MTIRVTRVSANVAGSVTDGTLRVTRVSAKVAGQVDAGLLRVTRTYAQVAGNVSTTDTLKVSTVRVQVATTDVTTDVPRYTSRLGTNFSTLGGATMVLGIPLVDDGGLVLPNFDRTATDTLSFTQSNTHNQFSVTGSNSVTFTQTNLRVVESGTDLTASGSLAFVGAAQRALVSSNTASNSISFTQVAGSVDVLSFTATSNISFTQSNNISGVTDVTATSPLSLTQSADVAGSVNLTGSDLILFTQSSGTVGPVLVEGNGSLVFSQVASPGLLTRTASAVIGFSNSSRLAQELILTSSNNLVFVQNTTPGLLTPTSHSEFFLTQSNNRIIENPNGTDLTGSGSLVFTQTNAVLQVLSTATALSALSTLTLTQSAIFPIELINESQSIVFSQSNSINVGKSSSQTIDFIQSVVANHDRNLTSSNTLNLSHGFTAIQLRDNIVIGSGNCDATKIYAPFSGGGASTIRPVAPILQRKTDVIFFTPAGPLVGATNSLTLRTPNFGDRDRNSYTRINRESRGGSLTIFRDPKWPKIRSLVMDFSGIKDSEVYEVIAFLEDTLGQEIALRDWNNRVWYGLIVNPDSAITRTGRDRNDIALEMEVTDTGLELNAGNSLTFTDSASLELV
jgi:hypothetical protein